MASDKIRCVFCQDKNDKIILFVSEKLQKCQKVLSVREKYKLKYNDIKLPAEVNETDGYHRQCYSVFTALMTKYRDSLLETDFANNSSLPSEDAASSLNHQTTVDVAASSSIIHSSINENSSCNEISDTNIDDIETDRPCNNVCFFCDKDRKQNKGKQQSLHSSNDEKLYEKIIKWMQELSNEQLLQKINNFKSTNRTIFYHHSCQLEFLNDYNRKISVVPCTSWHKNRNIHKDIFNHIVSIIEDEVLKKRKCVLLSSLSDTYNNELEYEQKRQPQSDISLITNHYLEEKILKYFKKSIKIVSKQKKNCYS